ncbi:hypothetical protein MY3296_009850 [Beauveria thailandica]
MALLWYAAITLSVLAAIHRLLQFHAVHSFFVSCASRTDTRHQTTFKSSERHLIPDQTVPASEAPGSIIFEFEKDGDGLLVQVPVRSWWRTVTARHRTQAMCREVDLISGDWAIRGFYASTPVRGPPEKPNLWYDIQVMYGPAARLCQLRRSGSERAWQLDHMILSVVQDAALYFKLCSTPVWLRLVYAAANAISPLAADALTRRLLWIQIRTMFFCHDTWEYRGRCRIFRIIWPFFNQPEWSWSHLRLQGCKIAIDLTAAGSDSKSPVGSLSVVDSAIIHCNTAIKTYPFTLTQSKEQGSTVITLSHSQIYKSTTFIGFPDGASISKNVDDWKIDYWQYGNNFKQGDVAHGESTPAEDRPASLLDSNDCVGKKTCQQRLVNIYNSANVFISHLITIGSVEVVTPAFSNDYNRIIYVDDTLQATVYPWWTAIASYLDSSAKINITGHDYPIKKGWVAFGDSYAAGIGAGTPLDADPNCYRGRGSYTAILDNIIQTSHHASIVWQSRSCSGETAEQFIKGEGAKQLEQWQPSFSDIATVSFTGNDFGFGDIVSHCLMGYPRGSQNQQCEEDLATTRRKLDTEHKVQDLVYNVLDKIYNQKSGHGRLMVYWTGYPQFFDATDKTCDSAYFSNYLIWAGRYLEAKLRLKLNEFSVELNQQVKFAIRRYNQFEPSPKAKFVDIDADSGIYTGHRFCEPGVKETLNTEQGQNTVAFFYPDGWDDIPSADEHFYMPPKQESQAPDKWSVSVQSSTCNDTEDGNEPLRPMLCSAAKAVANGTLTTNDIDHAAGEGGSSAVKNSDGSVTITDFSVAYLKMFHPKTRANWRIAQAVHDVMILHLN